MKKIRLMKMLQLCILLVLAAFFLVPLVADKDLYHLVAENDYVKLICSGIWAVFAISFLYLFYDYAALRRLRREYEEMDLAMYSDPLTGIGNRSSCDAFIEEYLERELPLHVGCITLNLDNIGEINRTYGPRRGNEIIRDFSTLLSASARGKCFVGRNGGNKFLAIFRETNELAMEAFVQELLEKVEKWNSTSEQGQLVVLAGVAINTQEKPLNINELVALSYNRAVGKNEEN